jgi:uncharacterized protein
MAGHITGLYAGLTAILLIGIAYRVVQLRRRHDVGLGDGGVPELQQAIRAHGNLVEYAPLALLLLLVVELTAALPAWALHVAGTAIVAGRALHAYGLTRSPRRTPGRYYGSILTWLTMLLLAALLIARGLLS